MNLIEQHLKNKNLLHYDTKQMPLRQVWPYLIRLKSTWLPILWLAMSIYDKTKLALTISVFTIDSFVYSQAFARSRFIWNRLRNNILLSIFFFFCYAFSLIIFLTMVITNSCISIDRLQCSDVLATLNTHTTRKKAKEKRDRHREKLIRSHSRFEESCSRCHKE